ncbi:hypothetical protein KSP39_PZI010666 [Platanthera zijinensis]|uniref:Conserved oligomeric Golgi complex subunit 8 n=1 Tax=Platanthera zijinensis TaxID=2320716 RepID=A0AAP0BHZ5_9ASPA
MTLPANLFNPRAEKERTEKRNGISDFEEDAKDRRKTIRLRFFEEGGGREEKAWRVNNRSIVAMNSKGKKLNTSRQSEAWLSGILDDLDQRNVYDYLKGMVNCHRMHLFDVVNQYRAIFSNDKSRNEENYDGGLLFSWSMHQIRNHLATLEIMLPKISEGGLLSNILDQCMVKHFSCHERLEALRPGEPEAHIGR